MSPAKRTPRFIAGAVCPQCRAIDRIVLEQDGDLRRRRCVACGYTDSMTTGGLVEPGTRLTRQGDRAAAPTAVRIVDPAKPKS